MLPYYVVGVGASAGGLGAFSALLAELPAGSDMVILLVQHLDPHRKSQLVDLLASKTHIPLLEAVHGQVIEPNHIYVIPSNRVMTLSHGQLLLTPRRDFPAPSMPVDHLFQSLADEQGDRAVGIILSGTGRDGVQGLRAIKAAGGVTYAQSEESAQFSGMPKAAIDSGLVDRVLSPSAIAQSLLEGVKHLNAHNDYKNQEESILASGSDHFGLLCHALQRATGVDFTHYKRATVQRRLARRMAMRGTDSMETYLGFLHDNPDEMQALFNDLLIQVTDFFRDAELFEGMNSLVFPKLFENRPTEMPIRFWVPGCASGEEVYSIAIVLMEYLKDQLDGREIQIFGTDISDVAIDKARAGIFPDNIAFQVSSGRLEKYFTLADGYYQIKRVIRDLCVFARHDLLRDPPFSRLDMISCRNLLIYLDMQLQKGVISRFHYALRPSGFLLLGASEGISAGAELFSAVDSRLGIFCKTPLVEHNRLGLIEGYAPQAEQALIRKNIPSEDNLSETERLQQEADRLTLEQYAPPGVLCDVEMNILRFRGDTSPFLVNPSGSPSLKLQKLIRPALLVDLGIAFEQARNEGCRVRRNGLRLHDQTGIRILNLTVMPLQLSPAQHPWFLVFFEDAGSVPAPHKASGPVLWIRDAWKKISGKNLSEDPQAERINRLSEDIEAARDYVRRIQIEHEQAQDYLKSTEQELLSSNEEFQSTNEELETAQEELQASNDELRARNHRLRDLNEELQRACDFAEAIVETVHHPLLVLDGNLRVVRANLSYHKLFRSTAEFTERYLFFDLLQGAWDMPGVRCMFDGILAGQCAFQQQEFTRTFPEIGLRNLCINAQVLRWDEQPLILLAISDNTEHQSALAALQLVNNRKDEFLAMLAHELRNPLAPIRNALEIWRRDTGDQAIIQQAQAMLERQLRQETRLLDDLLDMSRVSRGTITLKKTVFDLRHLLEGIVNDLNPEFAVHDQQLILNLSESPVPIEGDPARLQQVVLNLLNNAIKYTPVGGKISLSLVRKDQEAVLKVADNGIGISAELLPTIFDLFVQADKSLARTEGGLGLGLTLARRLVELHGGQLEARSEGPGKGSEFTMRLLMVADLCLENSVAGSAAREEMARARRKILVVDDNTDSAEGTALLLQMEGHEVNVAFDGRKALEMVQSFNPDVVVLDIGLAELDGYEVASRIRHLRLSKQPLLIAVTGYGQASDRDKALKQGFDEHLVKPVDIDRIYQLITDRMTTETPSR